MDELNLVILHLVRDCIIAQSIAPSSEAPISSGCLATIHQHASIVCFIAADDQVVHYIKHHARSLIFSASLPTSNTAAVLAVPDGRRKEAERVQRVHDKADRIRRGFLALGFNTGPSVTPTIPITIGDTIRTMGMWKVLFDAGVFVNSVLTPAAPKGVDLLRTSHIAWPHQCAPGYRVLSAFEVVGRNPQA